MKTIIVDNELIAMQGFKIECGDIPDIEIVGEFDSPIEALDFARNNRVEFALLDINMDEMSGIELAERLREISPEVIIVFVTGHDMYAIDAMRMKADYIIFKPYNKADVEDVIARVKLLKNRLNKRIYCKMFGRFDVFVDGKPVKFRLAKSKELFALCVYRRGGMVSSEEIIDKLWENYVGKAGDCSTFRTTVKDLKDVLNSYGVGDAFGRERNMCCVNTDMVDSDYYDFLNGERDAICDFQGEFLTDYEWSETAIYGLEERKRAYLEKK